ncbi:helix-turn-helix transcriptional regulator [bacterium]|nr:helix-turn-helix transcriptional regulator [bacterium]
MNLSPKEKEVLTLVARGYSDKEIGVSLNLTYGTVRTYVDRSIYKLNARNRTNAAVIYSLKNSEIILEFL